MSPSPNRRDFLAVLGAATFLGGEMARSTFAPAEPASGVSDWRREFPALRQSVNGHALAYLDSAATTLRPRSVIEAVSGFYGGDNANPSASGHTLARRAQERYEGARATLARFVHASDPREIVWTRGTTEAINLVASAWGSANLKEGDEVVVTRAEHYSNLVPWRLAAERAGARLVVVGVDDEGVPRLDELERKLSRRTKLVAVTHVSNVVGIVNPVAEIAKLAKDAGALVLVDGAQSVPHIPLDVQALGCDFFAFSSHKMLGPMGVGVLWAKLSLLNEMPPYQSGSNMTHDVSHDEPLELPEGAHKFQAGTPNASGPIGLAAAVELYETWGRDAIAAHERGLVSYALERLSTIRGLRVLGEGRGLQKVPVFAFTIDGVPVPRIVAACDARGVAVRGGDLAAAPLLHHFGVEAAARASCFLYTTNEEIDRLVDALAPLSS
jgi:SufS family cysteine desulfurase